MVELRCIFFLIIAQDTLSLPIIVFAYWLGVFLFWSFRSVHIYRAEEVRSHRLYQTTFFWGGFAITWVVVGKCFREVDRSMW